MGRHFYRSQAYGCLTVEKGNSWDRVMDWKEGGKRDDVHHKVQKNMNAAANA